MTKITAPVDPNSIVIPKKPVNKSASDWRKVTKPIMEKKRRARINKSLEQLKQILIENFHECSKKSNNLEKADILELTVKHLKYITAKQNQQVANQQKQQLINNQLAHTGQQTKFLNNNNSNMINKNLTNNENNLGKKGIQLIQNGFKDCKQQIYERLSIEDKQLSERVNNFLTKVEKQQFDQVKFNCDQGKFNCDQVLNLSIQDHQLANNSSTLLLHTPSSACSSSSSNVFFPQHSSNGGSLSPGSERSLSPSSDNGSVWRPW